MAPSEAISTPPISPACPGKNLRKHVLTSIAYTAGQTRKDAPSQARVERAIAVIRVHGDGVPAGVLSKGTAAAERPFRAALCKDIAVYTKLSRASCKVLTHLGRI